MGPCRLPLLLSLASGDHHGRSSTVMCKCPIRGDTSTVPNPKTGRMRKFSTRYWASIYHAVARGDPNHSTGTAPERSAPFRAAPFPRRAHGLTNVSPPHVGGPDSSPANRATSVAPRLDGARGISVGNKLGPPLPGVDTPYV